MEYSDLGESESASGARESSPAESRGPADERTDRGIEFFCDPSIRVREAYA